MPIIKRGNVEVIEILPEKPKSDINEDDLKKQLKELKEKEK